jgi:hypothetical protein
MRISVFIAKIFRERRSPAFGIFRTGPGSISALAVEICGECVSRARAGAQGFDGSNPGTRAPDCMTNFSCGVCMPISLKL